MVAVGIMSAAGIHRVLLMMLTSTTSPGLSIFDARSAKVSMYLNALGHMLGVDVLIGFDQSLDGGSVRHEVDLFQRDFYVDLLKDKFRISLHPRACEFPFLRQRRVL